MRESESATCALVGGAPLNEGVDRGEQEREVDKAQFVIRLNTRVPELAAADAPAGSVGPLGGRTDAIVVQRGSVRSFERYLHGWGEGNGTLGMVRRRAAQALRAQYPTVLFRSECPGACGAGLGALGKSALPAWGAVHLVAPAVEAETARLLEERGGALWTPGSVPSTGIVAALVALRMCARVRVFACNGSVTGDGDVADRDVWRGHALAAERRVLRWLDSCVDGQLCGRLTIIS